MPGGVSEHGFGLLFFFCQSAEIGEVCQIVALEEFIHSVFVTKTAQLGDLGERERGRDDVFFDLFELFVLYDLTGGFADSGVEQAVDMPFTYIELSGKIGDGDADSVSAVDEILHSANQVCVFVCFVG